MAEHNEKNEIVQGTLDMLILKTLTSGPLHGYAIVRRIQQASDDFLKVEEGSLYPALHRMERKGWIDAEWGLSESKRKAKYYRLTATGRTQLKVAAQKLGPGCGGHCRRHGKPSLGGLSDVLAADICRPPAPARRAARSCRGTGNSWTNSSSTSKCGRSTTSRAGMSPPEARQDAVRRFGDFERHSQGMPSNALGRTDHVAANTSRF